MKMKKKSNKIPFLATVSPAIIWLILFLVLPLLYIVGISFMKKGLYGGVIQTFDLTAYKTMFQSKYMKILLDSLWLSLKTTGLCLLFGYPFAYIISNTKKKWKPFCVLLIMLPFWINSLIRTYGWNSILREQGILNTLLMQLGIIKQPLQMLYTDGAVLLGMVYALIPFTVLPLYSSIEKLDHSLLEAASDLGASKIHVFRKVILPLTMPGIFAASVQTFIPSLGYFFITDMMGGATTMNIGNVIKNQFLTARNWPLGAVLAIALIAVTIVIMKLYTRVGSIEDMV